MNDVLPTRRPLINTLGLTLTVPLGLFYSILGLVIKVSQVTALTGAADLRLILRAWSGDLAFALIVTLFFAVALSRFASKLPALLFGVAHPLLLTYAVVITSASHGYFLATGSNLSWGPIGYWLSNFAETTAIMQSEAVFHTTMIRFALFALFVGCCVVLPRLPVVRRRLEPERLLSAKRVKIIAVAALAGVLVALLIRPPDGAARPAGRSIPWYIVSDAIAEHWQGSQTDPGTAGGSLDDFEFTEKAGAPRPNIVLIMFEGLNWKSTDLYFPGKNTTPFLAKLAREGTVVEHQYSVVPHTTKAVVSILCGIYPYLRTRPREALPGMLPQRCMAHLLRKLNYRTAFFQPAGNFEQRQQLVANMGFELFKGYQQMPQVGFERVSSFGLEDKIMVGPSLEWVDSVKGEPFFLTYLTLATHHHYRLPHSFAPIDFPVESKAHSNFLNAVRYTDSFIEEVFNGLEARGLIDKTVFIIVGDHGEAFGEHGRGQHDLILWEEGLRSAALLYGPQFLPPERMIKGVRSHLDLVPTIADLLGLTVPHGTYLGVSLFDPPPQRELFFSCWFNRQCLAVREGFLKTIYHYDLRPTEVFDNRSDPFDEHNLALTGPYDEQFLAQREKKMKRWVTRVNRRYAKWERALKEDFIKSTRPQVATRLNARLGDTIEVIGYTVTPTKATTGRVITFETVFKCLEPMTQKHKLVFSGRLNDKSIRVAHVPIFGSYPVEQWRPGEYVIDRYTIHIPAKLSDGEMKIYLRLEEHEKIDRRTRKRPLAVSSRTAPVEAGRLLVATVPVVAQAQTGQLDLAARRQKVQNWIGFDEPQIAQPLDVVFGGAIALRGATIRTPQVPLGATAEMEYVFRLEREIPDNWKVSVRLVAQGKSPIRGDHIPIGGLYPTEHWRAGEVVIDRHEIYIRLRKSKIGTYSVWVGFAADKKPISATGSGEFDSHHRVKVGTIEITAPKMRMGIRL